MTTLLAPTSAALADTGTDLVPWIIGGAVVLVIAGVALLLLLRRR